jgi:hypothetical protein
MKDQIPTHEMLMIVHEHLLEMSHRCVKESLALNSRNKLKAAAVFEYGLAFHCVAVLIQGAIQKANPISETKCSKGFKRQFLKQFPLVKK